MPKSKSKGKQSSAIAKPPDAINPVDVARAQANLKQVQGQDIPDNPAEAIEYVRRDIAAKRYDGASLAEITTTVQGAIDAADVRRTAARQKELEARQMVTSANNEQVLMNLIIHKDGTRTNFLMDLKASTPYLKLREAIMTRCGKALSHLQAGELRLFWVHDGKVHKIDSNGWRQYSMWLWCTVPWELHLQDLGAGRGSDSIKSSAPDPNMLKVPLRRVGRLLYTRYDVNDNGRMERHELKRMMRDLHLERLDCSPQLVERFIEAEFQRIDFDGSDGIGLPEFIDYVTVMKPWMRCELLLTVDESALFFLLAGKGAEETLPPSSFPCDASGDPIAAVDHDDGRGPLAVIDTGVSGVRLEMPVRNIMDLSKWSPGSGRTLPKVSVRTLAPKSATYLLEGEAALGKFPFSSVVRVDFPAFENGDEPPELGSEAAPPLPVPVTLIVPHSFDPKRGERMVDMAGAPHGGLKWQRLNMENNLSELRRDDLRMDGRDLRVNVPYAGTFCAFMNSAEADVCATRLYVFSRPELPREHPSTLRVHLCAEIPSEIEEMQFAEVSLWGISKCIGASHVLHLYQGVAFQLQAFGQTHEIIWTGMHACVEFVAPAQADAGREADADDSDTRESLDGDVHVTFQKGIGEHASNIRLVSRRAGVPADGFNLPFTVRLRSEVRPQAPILEVKERTPYDFTLSWQEPEMRDGDGDGDFAEITHYEIQLATTAPSGTYYPWQSLWCGAGHTAPDFNNPPKHSHSHGASASGASASAPAPAPSGPSAPVKSKGNGDGELAAFMAELQLVTDAEKAAEKEKAEQEEQERQRVEAQKEKERKEKEKNEPPKKVKRDPNAPRPYFSYRLPVDPNLFGQVRIRCWAEGDAEPSQFSHPMSLPRWKGKVSGVSAEHSKIVAAMTKYFTALTKHVTCGRPIFYRIGNPPSRNTWGGDAPPPPPPPTDKELQTGLVMAPVPYDVPQLPSNPEIKAAGDALAAFYREKGVKGGGGGSMFGLKIDHVLHAIHGTPTVDGKYSESRTVAGLDAPLTALCEVVYSDQLLPMLDTVGAVKEDWMRVDEKLGALIAQIATLHPHYALCERHLKEILHLLLEVFEMLRGCQTGNAALSYHLNHPDYSKKVKAQLKQELIGRVNTIMWRMSVEVVEMMLVARRLITKAISAQGVPIEEEEAEVKEVTFAPKIKAVVPAPPEKKKSGFGKMGKTSKLKVTSLFKVHGVEEEVVVAEIRAAQWLQDAGVAMARARRAAKKLRKNAQLRAAAEAKKLADEQEELRLIEEERQRRWAEEDAEMEAAMEAQAELVMRSLMRATIETLIDECLSYEFAEERRFLAVPDASDDAVELADGLEEQAEPAFLTSTPALSMPQTYALTPERRRLLANASSRTKAEWEALSISMDETSAQPTRIGASAFRLSTVQRKAFLTAMHMRNTTDAPSSERPRGFLGPNWLAHPQLYAPIGENIQEHVMTAFNFSGLRGSLPFLEQRVVRSHRWLSDTEAQLHRDEKNAEEPIIKMHVPKVHAIPTPSMQERLSSPRHRRASSARLRHQRSPEPPPPSLRSRRNEAPSPRVLQARRLRLGSPPPASSPRLLHLSLPAEKSLEPPGRPSSQPTDKKAVRSFDGMYEQAHEQYQQTIDPFYVSRGFY